MVYINKTFSDFFDFYTGQIERNFKTGFNENLPKRSIS